MPNSSPFPSLERQNPWLTFLLVIITAGLYLPAWLIIQRKGINSISQHWRLSLLEPVAILMLFAFDSLDIILNNVFDFTGDGLAILDNHQIVFNILTLIAAIWLVVLCLKVQQVFKDFVITRNYEVGFVSFYTIVLNIHYLQYKANQMLKAEAKYIDKDDLGIKGRHKF